mmetsp:Transcript_116734/g.203063  ORF Transcript_116734/g.203063 Transcript_116734/m.203063 type:complete len:286 (-) Transcript_116734:507-1364(-)
MIALDEDLKDLHKSILDVCILHLLVHNARKVVDGIDQCLILFCVSTRGRHLGVLVDCPRDTTQHEIAQVVRQLPIQTHDHVLVTVVPIVTEGRLPQEEVLQRVQAELVRLLHGVECVPKTLGNFHAILGPPPMSYNALRQRKISSHQESWPINGMELQDIFANHVEIRRPAMHLVFVLGLGLAHNGGSAVIGERIQPHVDAVLLLRLEFGLLRYRNRPLANFLLARHRKIQEPLGYKLLNLPLAEGRGNPIGVLSEELKQPILERRELELEVLLFNPLNRMSTFP